MFSRITTGWTVVRALYLIMGLFIIAQSVMEKEWIVSLIGIYFTSMGLFNYGCAAGACGIPASSNLKNDTGNTSDIEFNEIKNS